jgi:hypothetical protein
MITTTTKTEIFNTLQFYYTSRFFNIEGLKVTFDRDYKDATDFENALYKENTRMFFRSLISNEPDKKRDIPTTIKIEYGNFSREKSKAEKENWLKYTYNFVKDFKDNSLSNRIFKSEALAFYEWYDTMIIKQPENKDVKDEPKKELHNNIFVGNSFEVWELYRINKNITVNSATDLRVIFELMKKDTLIVETAELKHYINWLNKFYFKNNLTTLITQNLKSSPNIQRANDYKEYKKTTLKTP